MHFGQWLRCETEFITKIHPLDFQRRSLKANGPGGIQTEFTPTAVLLGLGIGSLICFTNLSLGLQSGWISMYVYPLVLTTRPFASLSP